MNGLYWNPQGQPAEDIEPLNGQVPGQSKAAVSVSASTATVSPTPPPPPPPPPPGPPPPPIIPPPTDGGNSKGGLGAVFAQLSQGDNVTKGLRKVDKSEMTHKNPSLRAAARVPDEGSGGGRGPAVRAQTYKSDGARARKQPKRVLEDNKWIIENYEREPQAIEIDAELSHSILISNCNNTTISIRGKANAVTIENTNRLNLIVDTLISSIDVIKSKNFGTQILGTVPTILLDQVDGAQIYLSKESSATRLFTSNATSVNLNVLSDVDGDYREHPLPSQICSYFDTSKDKLVTEIVDHSG
jgi:adenylyl cyclase-associated protein